MTFPEFMAMFQKQNSGDWATARQTWDYLHERLPCGHLRVEWVEAKIVRPNEDLMEKLIEEGWSHSGGQGEPYCSGCRREQALIFKARGETLEAAAWDEMLAKARLEEAEWWRHLVIMDEESYFAVEGDKRLAELRGAK